MMANELREMSWFLAAAIEAFEKNSKIPDVWLYDVLAEIVKQVYPSAMEATDLFGGKDDRGIMDIFKAQPNHAPAILPLSSNSTDDIKASLLRWALLYADTSVVAKPGIVGGYEWQSGMFDAFDPRHGLSISADGMGNVVSLRDFFNDLRPFREIIGSGRCLILPFMVALEGLGYQATITWKLPAIQDNHQERFLLPVNKGEIKDLRNLFMFEHFYLPYFPGVDMSDLVSLADSEGEHFRQFSLYLRKALLGLRDLSSVTEVAGVMEEIEYERIKLISSARKISRNRVLQGEIAFFGLSLASAFATGNHLIAGIAGIAGTVSIVEILKEYRDSQREKIDFKTNDFYIPYLLDKRRDKLDRRE